MGHVISAPQATGNALPYLYLRIYGYGSPFNIKIAILSCPKIE